MKRLSVRSQTVILGAIALAGLALIVALVVRHLNPPSAEEQALAALDGPFAREWGIYWLAQKDADSPTWHAALARCADARAFRPNCTHIRVAERLDAVPEIPEPALRSDLLERLERLAPLLQTSTAPGRNNP